MEHYNDFGQSSKVDLNSNLNDEVFKICCWLILEVVEKGVISGG